MKTLTIALLFGLVVFLPQAAADFHNEDYDSGDSYYSDYFEGEGDIDDCFDTEPEDHANSAMAEICDELGLDIGDWR